MTAKYWIGTVGPKDDFGRPIASVFYDARTIHGPWAIMNQASFDMLTERRLGVGYGQKYERQDDGRWLKTGG